MRRPSSSPVVQLLALAAVSLFLGGCELPMSSYETPYDQPTTAGLKSALARYSSAVEVKNEDAYCSMTDVELLHKFAAAFQRFDADCGQILDLASAQQREIEVDKDGGLSHFNVHGDRGSVVQTARAGGQTVRYRISAERRGGQWVIVDEVPVEDLAPAAPTAAYRAYLGAVASGDGDAACGLMTARGKVILSNLGTQRLGQTTSCEEAVPLLSSIVRTVPDPEISAGEIKDNRATLFVLQSDGHGQYLARFIFLKKLHGRWLFDHSQDSGKTGMKSGGSDQS